MDFVENIRVGEESTEAGFSAKQNRPSAIFGAGKVGGVSVTEDASAEGDELARTMFGFFSHE